MSIAALAIITLDWEHVYMTFHAESVNKMW